jgi:hypothetical protein
MTITETEVVLSLELVEAKPINPLAVFTQSGLDAVLNEIEREARALVLDISTPQGRKEIASVAHKIAKTKVALDGLGKDLVANWKEQAKVVDKERARGWARLEDLQKEIRKPLTDWEEAEKNRISDHEAAINQIVTAGAFCRDKWQSISLTEAHQQRQLIAINREWQEFSSRAEREIKRGLELLEEAAAKRLVYDAEQAELARLRSEEAARVIREREELIARVAAEKARRDAEELAAKREADLLREQREAAAKAEREQKAAAEREAALEAAKAKAIRDWEAAEIKAKEDARLATERAEAARVASENAAQEREKAAIERERQKVAEEREAEQKAAEGRAADKAHKSTVNIAAATSFISAGLSPEDAKKAVTAIAKGLIKYVRIDY